MKWLWQSLLIVALAIIVPVIIVAVLAVQFLTKLPETVSETVQESAEGAAAEVFQETQDQLIEQFPDLNLQDRLDEGLEQIEDAIPGPNEEALNQIGQEVLDRLLNGEPGGEETQEN